MPYIIHNTHVPGQAVPAASVPGPLVHEIKMPSLRNSDLKLLLVVGKRIFVRNDSDSTCRVPRGTLVAGFYKGKWWQDKAKKASKPKKSEAPEAAEPSETDVPFELKDADDLIQHAGKLVSLGSVILTKRESAPDEATPPGIELKLGYNLPFNIPRIISNVGQGRIKFQEYTNAQRSFPRTFRNSKCSRAFTRTEGEH